MGDALQLVEALSVERGALQERALSDGPIAGDLPTISAQNDVLLTRAQHSMLAAGLPDEAVTRAREILVFAREQVAKAIVHPVAERDPELVPAIIAQLYQRLSAVEGAIARAERETARADASVGALVAVGSLAVEMRAAAGWRSTGLSLWLSGRDLSQNQLDDAMYMTGAMQHAWACLQRQVLIVGEPPRLAAAILATRDGFFRQAEPQYRAYLAIARAGGKRPMALAPWRLWTVEALKGTLLARDAAIAEALAYGTTAACEAQIRLAIAVASAFGLLLLAGGALVVLLHRLVLPVQRLTAAITGLAGGDITAWVPERERHDEIGAMAAAVEVFRQNAVALRQTNMRFDAALSSMSQGLAMYDDEERLVVANARLCELSGVPTGSLQAGMTYRDVIDVVASAGHFPGRTTDEVYAERQGQGLAEGEGFCFEAIRGEKLVAFSSQPVIGGGLLFILEDITERRRNEARIAQMAHHDALTGIPNRVLFQLRLQEALARSRRGAPFAVLYLDLDRFKVVNDTLGHPVGDGLLQAVSARLQAELRETDTVARLGGDEFAILQVDADQPQHATTLAQRLVQLLGAPYRIGEHQVDVGVSIGISISAGDDDNADTLLKNADLALYRAKADGRGTWRFFEPEMDAHMQTRRLLELDLRRAVEAEQFEVHYQPVIDLPTQRITGFEALVRWRHAERGLVSPAEFIPLAEEIGLGGAIGEWVLLQACKEAAGWPNDMKVAVNVSAMQFRRGPELTDIVVEALRTTGLPAGRLELEITETAMLDDTEETLAIMHRIQNLGVAIAMDDFGMGFSSLSHLRRFPFNRVKIDQTFIRGLNEHGSDCAAIVRAIISLCASLNIAVTAEGVETEAQSAWLAAEGSVEAQGFWFSRPIPADSVSTLIETLAHSTVLPA